MGLPEYSSDMEDDEVQPLTGVEALSHVRLTEGMAMIKEVLEIMGVLG